MQIQELAAKLQALGLSDKEARVYVSALFLGPSSVQKIASQAEINRATAYVILDQLAELGLISQTQEGKKTVFVAESPQALERLFDRQKELIREHQEELKTLMPELKQTQRATDTTDAPVVRFYRGAEGVRSVSRENRRKARSNTEMYGMVNYDEVNKLFPDVIKKAPESRLRKNINSKVIYSLKSENMPTNKKLMRETHRVDKPVKADITLYEDRASFATYDKVVGVSIESKEIVGALRQLFELAWDNLSKKDK